MVEGLLALLGGLIAAYVTAKYEGQKERTAQITALAAFLSSIAKCLLEMEEALANNIVPTSAGHRLEEVLDQFDATLDRAPVEENKRSELKELGSRVRRSLIDGRFLDDAIKGHILRAQESEKKKMLHNMVQLAGHLEGQADVLRTIVE
jgi:hypothetical protein